MALERMSGVGTPPRRSLFLKLVLIYLGTTVVLMLTVGAFFRLTFDRPQLLETPFGRHVQKYVEHLADELGDPPRRDRALRLAQDLGVQIRVSTPQGAWATSADFPAESVLAGRGRDPQRLPRFGRYRDHFFAILDRPGTRYTFVFHDLPSGRGARRTLLWLITLIGLILGGSYLVVRWLFRPIFWLNEGVREMTKGNFAHQVPVRSGDELGRLTASFNHMVTQVREMVRAREQLLLDVSHELRSPLTRMKVGLEFVQEESVRGQLQQDARELEAMVAELLESERLSSDHGGVTRTEADLVALVRELVETYQDRQPSIRLLSTPQTLSLHVDVERVRVALRNVIENALKYSPATGPPVEVSIQRDEGAALVSVRDHGPGIPPEEQSRIFEPFYRVDKARERATGGYGLGLSLTKKIMMAHGGDVLLASDPGRGSTFTLQFPL